MKVICINGFNGKFSKDGVIEGKEYEGTFGPIQEGRLGVWTIEGIDGIVYPGYMFEDADRVYTFEKMMNEIEDGFVFKNTKPSSISSIICSNVNTLSASSNIYPGYTIPSIPSIVHTPGLPS